jgi:hypothetical protein
VRARGQGGNRKSQAEGSESTQQVEQAVLVAAIQPLLATHNRQQRATQGCLERQLACVGGAGHVGALLVVCDGLVALQREGRCTCHRQDSECWVGRRKVVWPALKAKKVPFCAPSIFDMRHAVRSTVAVLPSAVPCWGDHSHRRQP